MQFECKPVRKIWHVSGCLIMVAVLYFFKYDPYINHWFSGVTALVYIAWIEAGLLVAVDLLRLHSPYYNERILKFPIFGTKILRHHEVSKFNASTYYLLAAAFLMTLHWSGKISEGIIIMALLVLGIADPTAAWVRHNAEKKELPVSNVKIRGGIAFCCMSCLLIYIAALVTETDIRPIDIFTISLTTALVECFTKDWVDILMPSLHWLNEKCWIIPAWIKRIVRALYPDDNGTVPITVALTAFILGIH